MVSKKSNTIWASKGKYVLWRWLNNAVKDMAEFFKDTEHNKSCLAELKDVEANLLWVIELSEQDCVLLYANRIMYSVMSLQDEW